MDGYHCPKYVGEIGSESLQERLLVLRDELVGNGTRCNLVALLVRGFKLNQAQVAIEH